MSRVGSFLLLTWSLALPLRIGAQGDQASRPVLALLTQVEGEVFVISPDRSRKRPARVLLAVEDGERLDLTDGARVTLVCRNAAVQRIDRSVDVTLELCPAAPGEGGGLELHFASLELVGEARGADREDFDRKPVLVSPRCPAEVAVRLGCFRLLDPVGVRWLEAPGAETYHLELTGPRRYPRITVPASAASCSSLAALGGRRICSWPWPVEDWPLVEAREHLLEVVAVGGFRAVRSGKTLLLRLPADEDRRVRGALEAAEPRVGSAEARILTRAAILSGSGLVNETATLLESAARLSKSPALDLALAETYLYADLPELAFDRFRRVLASAGRHPDLRKLAELRLDATRELLNRLGRDPS